MLLAAGRGERMRPLTDTTPKPLLNVHGRALLDWHIAALQRDGVNALIVNTAWLGDQIPQHLDAYWPALADAGRLRYSHEGRDFGHALETAGGIARALPMLGEAFWLAAGDVFAPDFVFDAGRARAFAASDDLAHLWLVPNPQHNPGGDFAFEESAPASGTGRPLNVGKDQPSAFPRYTYSTIALLKAGLFRAPWCDIAPGNPDGVAEPLVALLRRAMDAGRVGASLYEGRWTDVGTPQRLAQLNAEWMVPLSRC
ncbi:nucleotidyltransferase family protein [Diaphorobacter aerolatus]|uniref:Nucleotidyltransferase family protein n=2 Tax=Diaphorobacter aerolatus TaxID=1288495 RepID=A0A7H0GQJ5_9BURK|nr:nucleotidyltransferase family protein [Diaphorobacter aerolatus]